MYTLQRKSILSKKDNLSSGLLYILYGYRKDTKWPICNFDILFTNLQIQIREHRNISICCIDWFKAGI